jgi:hypothetical protein
MPEGDIERAFVALENKFKILHKKHLILSPLK